MIPDGALALAALTPPQRATVVWLAVELGTDDLTWHPAACGCCVCLHPDGDTSHGWLIGADGVAEHAPVVERS